MKTWFSGENKESKGKLKNSNKKGMLGDELSKAEKIGRQLRYREEDFAAEKEAEAWLEEAKKEASQPTSIQKSSPFPPRRPNVEEQKIVEKEEKIEEVKKPVIQLTSPFPPKRESVKEPAVKEEKPTISVLKSSPFPPKPITIQKTSSEPPKQEGEEVKKPQQVQVEKEQPVTIEKVVVKKAMVRTIEPIVAYTEVLDEVAVTKEERQYNNVYQTLGAIEEPIIQEEINLYTYHPMEDNPLVQAAEEEIMGEVEYGAHYGAGDTITNQEAYDDEPLGIGGLFGLKGFNQFGHMYSSDTSNREDKGLGQTNYEEHNENTQDTMMSLGNLSYGINDEIEEEEIGLGSLGDLEEIEIEEEEIGLGSLGDLEEMDIEEEVEAGSLGALEEIEIEEEEVGLGSLGALEEIEIEEEEVESGSLGALEEMDIEEEEVGLGSLGALEEMDIEEEEVGLGSLGALEELDIEEEEVELESLSDLGKMELEKVESEDREIQSKLGEEVSKPDMEVMRNQTENMMKNFENKNQSNLTASITIHFTESNMNILNYNIGAVIMLLNTSGEKYDFSMAKDEKGGQNLSIVCTVGIIGKVMALFE